MADTVNDVIPPSQVANREVSIVETSGNQGTTKFADDTFGEEARVIAPTDLTLAIRNINNVPGASSIVDFLEKPTKVYTGALSTSDTGTMLTMDVWTAVVSDPYKLQKLLGVYLVRADIRVRLTVNATRFQQGRYILYWIPSGGVPVANPSYQAVSRAHRCNLTTITTTPHVEIDIAKETHVELLIPFTAAYPNFNMRSTGSDFSLGNVYMTPYFPLQAGSGSTTCTYTVWLSMENIELSMPAVPQSGLVEAYVQSGAKKSVTDMERLASGTGPISSVLSKLSMSSNILADVPLLGPTMSTVSWVTKHLARSADVWGFSKPLNLESTTKMMRNTLPYVANADGPSNAQPLALMSENQVVIDSGLQRTKVDEMDLKYISQQYSYYVSYSWSTATSTDTNIFSIPIQPSLYSNPYGKGTCYTPLALVQTHFRYWRGSIKFKIKMVKTEFHSGRLAIAFFPVFNGTAATLAATTGASQYLYREIVDIRETSEFEVCVPFVFPEMYCDVNSVLGSLNLTVLDALTAPNTVTQSIGMLVEVAAGDDIEFAYPTPPELLAYLPATVQSGYTVTPCFNFGASPSTKSLVPAAVSIGEQVNSLRQLFKKLQFSEYNGVPSSFNDVFRIYPFLQVAASQLTANTDPLLKDVTFPGDPISLWSFMYLFNSGGYRLFCFPSDANTSTNSYFVSMDQVPGDLPNSPTAYTPNWPVWGATRAVVNPSIEPFIDVNVPSYTRTIARVNSQHLVNSNDTRFVVSSANGSNTTYVGFHSVFGSYANPRTFEGMRSFSDDATFSGWYGIVPVVPRTAT